MKKRTLAILLCAVLLFSILPITGAAGGTTAPEITVTLSETEAVKDDSFTVTVKAVGGAGMAVQVELTYDSTNLTLDEDSLPGFGGVSGNSLLIITPNLGTDEVLAVLSFTVKDVNKLTANTDALFPVTEAKYSESLDAMLYDAKDAAKPDTDAKVVLKPTYMVKFMNGSAQLDSKTIHPGEKLSAVPADQAPETGYDFKGWTTDGGTTVKSGDQVKDMTFTADTTFTACFAKKQYTVTFKDAGGAAIIDPQTVSYGEPVAKAPDDPEPEEAGYHFKGWTADGGTSYVQRSFIADTAVTADTDYVAAFEKNVYTVAFKDAGGAAIIDPQSVEHGDFADVPADTDTAKTGYAFKGWKLEGTADTALITDIAATPVTADVTYVAVYKAQVTVMFMDGDTQIDQQVIDVNTAPVAPADADMAKSGYAFKGWVVNEDDTPVFKATVDAAAVTGDVTYKAVYKQLFELKFVVGGTAGDPILVEENALPTGLPDDPAASAGERFIGWTSDNGVSFRQKADIAAATLSADVTYTAVFGPAVEIVEQDADYIGGYVRVVIAGDLDAYRYDGQDMYQLDNLSENYDNTFAYLYKADAVLDETVVLSKITAADALADKHDLAGRTGDALYDVNATGTFDLADVRAAFNCATAEVAENMIPQMDFDVFVGVCLRADVAAADGETSPVVDSADWNALVEALSTALLG